MKNKYKDLDIEDFKTPPKKKPMKTVFVCLVIVCVGLFTWIKLDSMEFPVNKKKATLNTPLEDSSPMLDVTEEILSLDNAITAQEEKQTTTAEPAGTGVLQLNIISDNPLNSLK